MSAPETSLSITETDASEQLKPEIIHFEQGEVNDLQGALNNLTLAQNQLQALLWQSANRHGVDLAIYELHLPSGGFKKK